jgi:acetyl esterase/lipase
VIALGLLAYSPLSRADATDVTPKDTGVEVIQGIAYLTDECPGEGTQAQLADAYLPSPPLKSAAPAVILVHGGGFVSGERGSDWFVDTGTYLASKGWAVFSIDYCMPPRGTAGFPVEVQNVQAAVAMLTKNASTYRVDPRRIAVWGSSAGATLATHTAALAGKEQGEVSVVAAVGWSGAYDFTDFTGASPGNILTSLNYLGCDPRKSRDCMATARDASPVSHVTSTTPPMMLVNSVDEQIPLNQFKVMKAALVEADVEVRTLVLPGGRHGLNYSSSAFCPTVAFLETYLSPIPGTCAAP